MHPQCAPDIGMPPAEIQEQLGIVEFHCREKKPGDPHGTSIVEQPLDLRRFEVLEMAVRVDQGSTPT